MSTQKLDSEIGKLQHVLVHTPGPELEKVTPENAHTFLFSDILNMQVAQKEYSYFKRVLQKVAEVHEIGDLLTDILQMDSVKNAMVDRVCKTEDKGFLAPYLKTLPAEELSRQLIEGVRRCVVHHVRQHHDQQHGHDGAFTRVPDPEQHLQPASIVRHQGGQPRVELRHPRRGYGGRR